jgi:hypothetical protein
MAILNSIPHLVPPTGGGVSTLVLTASGHDFPFEGVLRAHIWIVPVALALACFLAAITGPNRNFTGPRLSYRTNALIWSAAGVFMLILAAYLAVLKGV